MDHIQVVDQLMESGVVRPEWDAFYTLQSKVIHSNAERVAKTPESDKSLSKEVAGVFACYPADPRAQNKTIHRLSEELQTILKPAPKTDRIPGATYIAHLRGGAEPLLVSKEKFREFPYLSLLKSNAVDIRRLIDSKSRPKAMRALALQMYVYHYIYVETMQATLDHPVGRALRVSLINYLMSRYQRTITSMLESMYTRAGIDPQEKVPVADLMWDAAFVESVGAGADLTSAKLSKAERQELDQKVERKSRWTVYNGEIDKIIKTVRQSTVAASASGSQQPVNEEVARALSALIEVRAVSPGPVREPLTHASP